MDRLDTTPLFKKAVAAINNGKILSAMGLFEKLLETDKNSKYISYYGFCIAKERGQHKKGIELCKQSLQEDPKNTDHLLNLGRIYLLIDRKDEAIGIFREALAIENNPQIVIELNKLGSRRAPLFRFLKRGHPVNKYLGLLLSRLKLLK